MLTGKIYHPEDKHPADYQGDLNPDAGKGQNYGTSGENPAKNRHRMAFDVKEAHQHLHGYTHDLLKQIPILAAGSRLEQDATYIDLADDTRTEFRARGDQDVEAGQLVVPKAEVDYQLWNRLRGITDPARIGGTNAG